VSARKPTDQARFDALVERGLRELKRRKKPPTVAELNGLRRLMERRDQERQLEEARRLTTE
jgi:hypothetical protein